MPFGLRWRDQLPPVVVDEFENLISDILSHFSVTHDEDGNLDPSVIEEAVEEAIAELGITSGADGSSGQDGEDGATGWPGQKGDQGIRGVMGPQGLPGQDGEDDSSWPVIPNLTGFIPYVGATTGVDLGSKSLTTTGTLNAVGAGSLSQRFGVSAVADGVESLAIGPSTSALATGFDGGKYAVAIGRLAVARNLASIVIGRSASEDATTLAGNNVVIGSSASAVNNANEGKATAIGARSIAGDTSVAVGNAAEATVSGSVAFGESAKANFASVISLGRRATGTAQFQFVVGSLNDGQSGPMSHMYIGTGVVSTDPGNIAAGQDGITINATGGSGTDIPGAKMTLAGGRPTGSGAGGDILFSTAEAGATGTTLRALVERMRVNSLGNVAIGTSTFPATGTRALVFGDGTVPGTMGSNTAAVFADDVGGTVEMMAINEANIISQLTGLNIRKTADESISSATQQADDHLTVQLAASSSYAFEIHGHWTAAGGTPGIAVQLDGTVGVSSLKADVIHYDHSAGAFTITRITAFNSPVGRNDTGDNSFVIKGCIETTTAGTLFLEWAQNTLDAGNATVLQENSTFTLRKLNA